jgi:hypothetical protein
MTLMSPAPPLAAEAVVEQAVSLHKAGRLAEAEQLYRRALAVQPDHPEGNHNLGIILMQRGQLPAGLGHFKIALQSDPSRDLYWLSCARPAVDALLSQIGPAAAAPDDPEAYLSRGDAFAEAGRLEDAAGAYRQALAIDPDFAEAHHHLGTVLAETGHIAEGFAHLMRRAELVRGADDPTAGGGRGSPHKVKHDREQRAYLIERGLVRADAPDPIFHLGDGARLDGPAVNPDNATPELLAQWRAAAPQLVVIEDFLTAPALARLRAYCADSTIWRRNYDAGYIGATPPDGFACPLLAQIAEEIREVYAGILAPHDFHYLGAFKYDSELSTGTNTHADVSAVNVNFYIAPDEANLGPESGGMLVWDIEAASEAEMRRYNSDEPALQAHLKRSGAKATHIAHRANRAVIFKSSLFHKTDECRFQEGYLNKRINVSLLYGQWGAGTR